MIRYDNATTGLRYVLARWSAGCTGWVGFPAYEGKLDALSEKWADSFGTRLPGHVRHARQKKGWPNAYACAHPLHGSDRWQVWLLRTAGDDVSPITAWSREKWIPAPPSYGRAESQLVIVREPRPRRDYAWTWRLSDRHLNSIGSHWRSLVLHGDADTLAYAIGRATSSLPMFGGIRRQVSKELAALERLWRKKWPNRAWPGPVSLPMMGRFGTRKPVQEGM